jgi:uncharacterized protein (TIGR02246 family)
MIRTGFMLFAWTGLAIAQVATVPIPELELKERVARLDRTLFEAYNKCDLDKFAELFAPDVEFYHDKGGVTRTRQEVVDNTRKYICGKVRRELIAGTLEAYPVKDYGAIATGEHRFCEIATGKCEGIAKFVLVWRNDAGAWTLTRVLSFGHRPA